MHTSRTAVNSRTGERKLCIRAIVQGSTLVISSSLADSDIEKSNFDGFIIRLNRKNSILIIPANNKIRGTRPLYRHILGNGRQRTTQRERAANLKVNRVGLATAASRTLALRAAGCLVVVGRHDSLAQRTQAIIGRVAIQPAVDRNRRTSRLDSGYWLLHIECKRRNQHRNEHQLKYFEQTK